MIDIYNYTQLCLHQARLSRIKSFLFIGSLVLSCFSLNVSYTQYTRLLLSAQSTNSSVSNRVSSCLVVSWFTLGELTINPIFMSSRLVIYSRWTHNEIYTQIASTRVCSCRGNSRFYTQILSTRACSCRALLCNNKQTQYLPLISTNDLC